MSFQTSPWRLTVIVLFAASVTPRSIAQQTAVSTDAVQVMGMTGVKNNSKGRLEITEGTLSFTSAKNNATVSVGCIDDVVTGRDSERVLRGPLAHFRCWRPMAVEEH